MYNETLQRYTNYTIWFYFEACLCLPVGVQEFIKIFNSQYPNNCQVYSHFPLYPPKYLHKNKAINYYCFGKNK